VIDVHCHLLPGVDDGPETMGDAIALAKACVADGIQLAITTPHCFPGKWDNDIHSLLPVHAQLTAELALQKIPLEVRLGAEVRISEILPSMAEAESIPLLGSVRGYRIILLELPDGHIPGQLREFVHYLLRKKIRPLLAHPERNKAIMHDPEKASELVEMGCWLQVTAASLLGQFGKTVQTATIHLLDKDWVYVMASDCHSIDKRPPKLTEATKSLIQRYDVDYAKLLVLERPAEICGLVPTL